MILLVAIVIFSGMETPANASLAKFMSEFSDYSLAVRNDYVERYHKNSIENVSRTKAQVYYEIASGRNDIEMNTPTVSSMSVVELEEQYGRIFPEDLNGNECYEVTHDYNIKDIKRDKYFYVESEKHYITDEGIAFVLPGYPEYGSNDVKKWWINEKQYYTGEPRIPTENSGEIDKPDESGEVIEPIESGEEIVEELVVKEVKITTDKAGTSEAGNSVAPDTKLYIQIQAYEGTSLAATVPPTPYEISENGEYEFTIVGSKGQTIKHTVNVDNYRGISLADILTPGNYVSYTPDTKQYTPNTADTGYNRRQTLRTERANWRVIYTDPDTGEVLVTPEGAVNLGTYLAGLKGYYNGVSILNEMCSALYSNAELGITARSMTVEDLDKACGYSRENIDDKNLVRYAYYISNGYNPGGRPGGWGQQNETVTYNGKTYTKAYVNSGWGSSAKFFVSDAGGTEGTDQGYTYKTPETDNPVYVTQSYYSYIPGNEKVVVGNILGSEYCWLATQCVYLDSTAEYLSLRAISKDETYAYYMYNSTGKSYEPYAGIRPVISLDSSKLWIDDSNSRNNGSSSSRAYQIVSK